MTSYQSARRSLSSCCALSRRAANLDVAGDRRDGAKCDERASRPSGTTGVSEAVQTLAESVLLCAEWAPTDAPSSLLSEAFASGLDSTLSIAMCRNRGCDVHAADYAAGGECPEVGILRRRQVALNGARAFSPALKGVRWRAATVEFELLNLKSSPYCACS